MWTFHFSTPSNSQLQVATEIKPKTIEKLKLHKVWAEANGSLKQEQEQKTGIRKKCGRKMKNDLFSGVG